jgi:hypothetical protein
MVLMFIRLIYQNLHGIQTSSYFGQNSKYCVNIMAPRWVFIFSWWGFALSILRLMGLSPISPLLILILNCLGTMVFLILKENIGVPVSLFILLIHVIPVYIFRKDRIDIPGSLVMFALYILFLNCMGTSIQDVYARVLTEPMPTIGSYLSSRLSL